jgi:hypothetical protein
MTVVAFASTDDRLLTSVTFSAPVEDWFDRATVVLRSSVPIVEVDASDVPLLSTVLANSVETAVVFDGKPVSFAGVINSVVALNSPVERLSVAEDVSFEITEAVDRLSVEVPLINSMVEVPFNSPVEVPLIDSVEAPAMVVSISVDEPLTASVDEPLTNSVDIPAIVVDISVDEPLTASVEEPLTNSVDAPAMVVANSVDEPLIASIVVPLANSVEMPAVVVRLSVDEPLTASVELPLTDSVEAVTFSAIVDDSAIGVLSAVTLPNSVVAASLVDSLPMIVDSSETAVLGSLDRPVAFSPIDVVDSAETFRMAVGVDSSTRPVLKLRLDVPFSLGDTDVALSSMPPRVDSVETSDTLVDSLFNAADVVIDPSVEIEVPFSPMPVTVDV